MKKNVWLYLVFTFVLTYGAVFGLMLTGIAYGSPLCMAVFSLWLSASPPVSKHVYSSGHSFFRGNLGTMACADDRHGA